MTPSGLNSDCGWGTSQILLLDFDDQHAAALAERLRSHNLRVDMYADPQTAIAQLRRSASEYEVVIINVSSTSVPWPKRLQELHDACRRLDVRQEPLFLCVSKVHQRPEVVLRIERAGARYVREQ